MAVQLKKKANEILTHNQMKLIFWGMVIIYAAVLIPLFWIARYNFMCADDYSFAHELKDIWNQTNSAWSVFKAAFSLTKNEWHNWQGTYACTFLNALLLAFCGENAYYIGTVLTLGGFSFAGISLLMLIFIRVLDADPYVAGIISMSCSILQILLVPVPSEAFYWQTGAVAYTFFYAAGLLLCLLWIMLYNHKNHKKAIVYLIFIPLLSIFIAGGNYITGLTVAILYVLCAAKFWQAKHKGKYAVTICMLLYFAFFLGNIMAPGNANRQTASSVVRISAVESILISLKEGAEYIIVFTILPVVIVGIMLVPFFIAVVGRKKYRYPFPALVSVVSFCIFAAQFTPIHYALGKDVIAPGRVLNLYRFSYFFLIYGNELYWIGWCYRKWTERFEVKRRDGKPENRPWLLIGWCIGGLLLCCSLARWGGSTVTSFSAVQSLRRGEAQQYYAEHQQRLAILEEDTSGEVYLSPFTVKPYVLFFSDIEEGSGDWRNSAMAAYYHKTSILLK